MTNQMEACLHTGTQIGIQIRKSEYKNANRNANTPIGIQIHQSQHKYAYLMATHSILNKNTPQI